jgi:small subunit ribosomal protein S18
MAMKKQKRKKIVPKIVATNCPFCKGKFAPDYRKFEDLTRFITDRGKIVGKSRSGLCAKHQRRLGVAIKRARHLGLLPFTAGI